MKIKGSPMTGGTMSGIFRKTRIVSLLGCLFLPSMASSKCVSDSLFEYLDDTVNVKSVDIEQNEFSLSGGFSNGVFQRNRNAYRFRDTIFFEIPSSDPRSALIFGVHSYDESLLTGSAERSFVDVTYIIHRLDDAFSVICSDDPEILSAPPDGVVEMYRDDDFLGK